ncbi:FecR family protein [Prolixibacteraceae bacterium Z1-6]|uniref:FecR family protein n=1 Tax=Draconibacterium aestuarii TaxID=2998507 RepID=A0A9X3J4X4_9BACT|nr:FecR family protein [Prolixibacteraceae bacterium Z1-6]
MSKKIEALFLAYLEGTISLADEQFLLEWLKNNPNTITDFNDFRRIWNMSKMAGTLKDDAIELEWMQLRDRINTSDVKETVVSHNIWYWLPRIAAVFLLGAMVAFTSMYLFNMSENNELTFHEINTPPGAKSKITLPDGTIIWLNAGSNVKYSNEFGKKQREIQLTGEAYFEVFHNPSKVFLVRTSELNIKAYGTAFNVKSYPEEGTIETTLIEGSIGVTRRSFENKKNDEVLLEPNQRVVYYRKSNKVETINQLATPNLPKTTPAKREEQKLTYLISKGIDTKEFTSWKDGTLFITSESLKDLAVILERKYDVKIHFDSEELKDLKFTGSLENETVEQVIDAIGIAAQIDYTIDEREIWLKEKMK